jgi:hypothetical protein
MREDRAYVGIHNDKFGGMTPTGTIIKDAWVFGILPEDEGCEGWTPDRIQVVYDQVSAAWAPYGHLASNLPPELRERHARIFGEAFERAQALGWSPDLEGEE